MVLNQHNLIAAAKIVSQPLQPASAAEAVAPAVDLVAPAGGRPVGPELVRDRRRTRTDLDVLLAEQAEDAGSGEDGRAEGADPAGLHLEVEARGDLRHHLVEDVAIALGIALAVEVPSRAVRYGWALVPMDDALVQVALDVGGRFWYEGPLPSDLYDHFLRSLAENVKATLHVRVLRGRDEHHVVEAAMKAVGLSLRQALAEGEDVFSTKGSVRLELRERT